MEYQRRFVVGDVSWLPDPRGAVIVQGYLFANDSGWCVRVRRRFEPDGPTARELDPTVAVKGPRVGGARTEYEMRVDVSTAAELLRQTPAKVVKTRHSIVECGLLWAVDVFHLANEGLIVAECETESTVTGDVRPPWAGREVTGDRRFDNERLARRPYGTWAEADK